MIPITPEFLILVMAIAFFGLGLLAIITGIAILISKTVGGEIKAITQQTTRLAQKGIAEDVAGLVGNASSLIDAFNQLVRTTTGIGIFLVIVGIIMNALAFFLLIRFQ
jgi:hypothetical protein